MKNVKKVVVGPGKRKTNDGFTEQMNEKKIVNEQDQNKISNSQTNLKEPDTEDENDNELLDATSDEDKKEKFY
ncbi:MAG TPA: hypothetical protein VK625_23910 [Flavitalea sp.]|nr:hypothetical protein [Flavitalea sp.]